MTKIFLHSKTGYISRWNDSTKTYWFARGEEEFEIPADIVEESKDWEDKTKEGIVEEIEKGSYIRCISKNAITNAGKHIVEKGRIVKVLSIEKDGKFLTSSPANEELMRAAYPSVNLAHLKHYVGTGYHFLSDYEFATEEEYLMQNPEPVKEGGNTVDIGRAYELVSFRSIDGSGNTWTWTGIGWLKTNLQVGGRRAGMGTEDMLHHVSTGNAAYNSIKRKSDGQIFTIGDTIHCRNWIRPTDIDTITVINPDARSGIFRTRLGWHSELEDTNLVEKKQDAPRRAVRAAAPEFIDMAEAFPAVVEEDRSFRVESIIGKAGTANAGLIYKVLDFNNIGARLSTVHINHRNYDENRFGGIDNAQYINDNFDVYSVRRLRDDIVFTIGDRATFVAAHQIPDNPHASITITEFMVNGDRIHFNHIFNLNGARKIVVDLVSDDGVELFANDRVFVISKTPDGDEEDVAVLPVRNNHGKSANLYYFSTMEIAKAKLKELLNEEN